MDQAGNPPIYTPPALQVALTAIPGPVPNQQQMTGQVVTQPYVITIDANTEPSVASNLRGIGRTAIIQLVCASVSAMLGLWDIAMGLFFSRMCMPIWLGLCVSYIVTNY